MLTCSERDLGNILCVDGRTIESDLTEIVMKAENGLHKRSLTCAVFTEQADDLSPRERNIYIFKCGFAAVSFS